jgi:hypothetical protein
MKILIGAKWMICQSFFKNPKKKKKKKKKLILNPISSFETKR